MKYDSKEFRDNLYALADRIGAPYELVTTYAGLTGSVNGEYSVVSRGDDKYEWHYSERGVNNLLAIAESSDELLYVIFEGITHNMAFVYESKNRIENQDARLIAFKYQLTLMKTLNDSWHKRLSSRLNPLISAIERQAVRKMERSYKT